MSVFERQASSVAYAASTVSVVSGLTINEWGVIGGLLLATLTFVVNWYYRHRTFKLAEMVAIVEEVLDDVQEREETECRKREKERQLEVEGVTEAVKCGKCGQVHDNQTIPKG